MVWKDCNGVPLHYGDEVLDLEKQNLGYIVPNPITIQPQLHIIKQYSYKMKEMVPVPEDLADKNFIPHKSRLYWFFHNYQLDNILLIKTPGDSI